MLRLMIIIVAVAAISVGLVYLRREEARVSYDIHRSLSRQTGLRRKLWDQRLEIGHLVAPAQVQKRMRRMVLDMSDEDEPRIRLADGTSRRQSRDNPRP